MKLGYSRKDPNRGGSGYTFLRNPSGIFKFVSLPLENPEKTNFHPWKFCVTSLGDSKVKSQDPCKFDMNFSLTPLTDP